MKRLYVCLFLAAVWDLPSQSIEGQPVLIQERGNVKLLLSAPQSPGNVQVGMTETLKLSIEIKGPLEVKFPETLTSTAGWREWRRTMPNYLRVGQGEFAKHTFEVAALAPGDFSLELAPWKVRSPSAAWENITWTPLTVHVSASLKDADLKSLRDITAIETIPERPVSAPEWPWWWLGFGAAAMFAAVGGCVLFLRRTTATRSKFSAEQFALQRLERLAQLSQDGSTRRVHRYGLLANVVRGYLARRYQLPARRRTTNELLELLNNSNGLPASNKDWIGQLLRHCDQVRFGARPVVDEDWVSWIGQTRKFFSTVQSCGENKENA